MPTDSSRKARHNSFAHHRAELLFAGNFPDMRRPRRRSLDLISYADLPSGPLHERIIIGIKGFRPIAMGGPDVALAR